MIHPDSSWSARRSWIWCQRPMFRRTRCERPFGRWIYNDWVSHVLRFRDDPVLLDILENDSAILNVSNDHLRTALSSFVLSLRKRDGTYYSSGSLISVVTALQKHLEINGRRVSLLNDPQFNKLKPVSIIPCNCDQKGVGLVKGKTTVI